MRDTLCMKNLKGQIWFPNKVNINDTLTMGLVGLQSGPLPKEQTKLCQFV